MSKTMSVRMDRENYEFLHEITKEEGGDLAKAIRDMKILCRTNLDAAFPIAP